MCGILGFSGPLPPKSLARANGLQAHRGPDDCGQYVNAEAGIALGHVRLSILDLSSFGHQPMVDESGQVVIVFNGEIYNFRELRRELEQTGCSFRSHSDTEVLLNLYLRDSQAMLKRLNGIFALAIWDGRRGELLLARDGMGVKPLYIAETRQGFSFASEIKALLAISPLDLDIDVQALRNHLTYLWCPAPKTIFSAVRKVEPGCALWVRDGRIVKTWRHYHLPEGIPVEGWLEKDAIEAVRGALKTAVERQMVADVPVGAFLSGGLDSSSVVAFARNASHGNRLQCFTIALNDKDVDHEGLTADLPYAEAVARHLEVDLHTVHVGPEMADLLPEMIYHLDEPQADPAPLNALLISRLAREHGIKVLLSGAGGDDIFSGYRRHQAALLERYWAWLPQAMRGMLANIARIMPVRSAGLRRLGKAFQYANLNGDERIASYFYWLNPRVVDGLLSPELRALNQDKEPLVNALEELPEDVPTLNRMLHLECRNFLADHNLNYTDKMSMAAGVEVRVPLLDLDLVDLAFSLPVEFKQRGSEGKWIFKKAMEGVLPNNVIYRPKTGFGAPLRRWMQGPLAEMVGDVLSQDALKGRGWFDPSAVHKLIETNRQGLVDATYPIFAVLCVELWARAFIDNN
jgi:asparagine synthase (glutamine-hydrolysing)